MSGAHALVVGGTGMLEAATRHVAAHWAEVTLVARDPFALAEALGATPCALDWAAPEAGERIAALGEGFDLALIWLHEEASGVSRAFEDRLRPGGRLVRVMGSAAMDPAVRDRRAPDPRADIHRQLVITGWHPDATQPEGRRWLTHAEISGGVIAALRDPALEAMVIGGSGG